MTATIADSILNEDPYPTRALILDGTSPAYAIPNLEKQEAAFEKLNFIVSFDVFMGESTLWADIVLPSITYLETWDVAHNYGAPETLGLRQPVIDSLGESCLTANTLVELARRLQLDYFDFTYRDYVAEGVKA
ncbi:MAG: molybdopterin-dependent oxidoreductase, partial [Chloroflexi bacterium]|nr:molybdopterin-dependent oxidoreductase [Chloroflexota bacterium]